MTYKRFEDFPVWQKAAELYELTQALLESEDFKAPADTVISSTRGAIRYQ